MRNNVPNSEYTGQSIHSIDWYFFITTSVYFIERFSYSVM